MRQIEEITRLADELGSVRNEIKSLRTREAELRDQILSKRLNAPIEGRDFKLIVRQGQRRSFNHKALPEDIHSNSKYWKITDTTTVVTLTQPRNAILEEENDFQVIEPF